MKTLKKMLHVIVFSLPILLLPICAIAMEYTGNGGAISVPEPSTLVLLAASGGVIMLVKGFRKKK